MNEDLINLDDYDIVTENGESISVGFYDVTFISDGEARPPISPQEVEINIETEEDARARLHRIFIDSLMDAYRKGKISKEQLETIALDILNDVRDSLNN